MKKIQIMTLFTCISIITLHAQINLEHTFNTNSYVFNFNNSSQIMYYCYVENNNVKFFNENFTLYKSLNIVNPNGYSLLYINYPSDILFNNNALIEFICTFKKDDNTDYQSKLYDENGNILQTFNNSTMWGIHNTINNGYRMTMVRYTTYPYSVVDVYSLPGTLTSTENNDEFTNYEDPFPNPSKEYIYLPYSIKKEEITEMKIYSIEGQLIETRKIEGMSNEILINTISYPPGIYFYKYHDKSRSFIIK